MASRWAPLYGQFVYVCCNDEYDFIKDLSDHVKDHLKTNLIYECTECIRLKNSPASKTTSIDSFKNHLTNSHRELRDNLFIKNREFLLMKKEAALAAKALKLPEAVCDEHVHNNSSIELPSESASLHHNHRTFPSLASDNSMCLTLDYSDNSDHDDDSIGSDEGTFYDSATALSYFNIDYESDSFSESSIQAPDVEMSNSSSDSASSCDYQPEDFPAYFANDVSANAKLNIDNAEAVFAQFMLELRSLVPSPDSHISLITSKNCRMLFYY